MIDAIEQAAREQNGWTVIAVAITRTGSTVYGVVAFQHSTPDDHFGTAELRSDDGDAVEFSDTVSFHWGHYDMSRELALKDFAERVTERASGD